MFTIFEANQTGSSSHMTRNSSCIMVTQETVWDCLGKNLRRPLKVKLRVKKLLRLSTKSEQTFYNQQYFLNVNSTIAPWICKDSLENI